MTSFWQKSLVYLGLVDEERLDDEETGPVEPAPSQTATAPQRIEPPRQVSRGWTLSLRPAESGPDALSCMRAVLVLGAGW